MMFSLAGRKLGTNSGLSSNRSAYPSWIPNSRVTSSQVFSLRSSNRVFDGIGWFQSRFFAQPPKANIQAMVKRKNPKLYSKSPEFLMRARMRSAKRKKLRGKDISGPKSVVIPAYVTPKILSSVLNDVQTVDVLKVMIKMGLKPTSSTELISSDIAEIIATEFGFTVQHAPSEKEVVDVKSQKPADVTKFPKRPPVVAVMGHINHGKTSLLDALRDTRVVDTEAGGITQKVSAFAVNLPSKDLVTFVDTPGHAAFAAMRSRGARATDIAVVVVAIDDGVREQTVEVLKAVKEAKIPLIIALNKCDKPGIDAEKVKRQLLENGITVEDFGGDVPLVKISALKKQNLDGLIEAILYQAEVLDLRADTGAKGEAAIVESRVEKGLGPVSTIIVRWGTLKVNDTFVAGTSWGKVRMLRDDKGKMVKQAGPSMVVDVIGFKKLPEAGADLLVVENEKKAKEVIEFRLREIELQQYKQQLEERKRLALAKSKPKGEPVEQKPEEPEEEGGFELEQEEETSNVGKVSVPVIVRGESAGAVEAVTHALFSIPRDELAIQIVNSGVGELSDGDLELANTVGGIVTYFGNKPTKSLKQPNSGKPIVVVQEKIIYDLLEKVKDFMGTLLKPRIEVEISGTATVQQVFEISTKAGPINIAGCTVDNGIVRKGSSARVVRDGKVIQNSKVITLKHFKNDVAEIKAGSECGIGLEFKDIEAGDVLEVYKVNKIPRKLGDPKETVVTRFADVTRKKEKKEGGRADRR